MLNGLPEKIVRHPELFVVNGASPEEAKIEKQPYSTKAVLPSVVTPDKTIEKSAAVSMSLLA
ncbi:MAG: hypothetical protein EPN89_04420 [Methylovulum sp.]|nr:MAG: hypothetical protein EPN89_04420 [Methylovulum sp.]